MYASAENQKRESGRTEFSRNEDCRRTQRGSTILSAVASMAVLGIVSLGTLSSMVSSNSLEKENRETAMGTAAARTAMEEISAIAFEDVFSMFNDDPMDDPEGPYTAPGGTVELSSTSTYEAYPSGMYAVQIGSEPQPSTEFLAERADLNMTVQIIFPTLANGTLSESAPALFEGMPTDLDGDGKYTTGTVELDYKILPVVVRVTWQGVRGTKTISIPRILTKQSWQKESTRLSVVAVAQ